MIDVSQISPRSSTMHDIQQYNTNLNNLYAGNVFQPASPEQIIDVRQCCYRSCTYYLSRIVIETLRLVIPLDSKAMRDFHFNKMKEMYDGSQFVYVIDGEAITKYKKEIMDGHTQAKIHGNDSISLKSKKYYKTMAELAVTLEDLTQDNPHQRRLHVAARINQKGFDENCIT
uniref:Uncharacterized protein n=1 Tax=Panagrolaimus superbus TaxID=310955 RepID=A0A914XUR8_9BILA